MKKIIFLVVAGWCGLALAQTNAPAPTNAPAADAKPHPPTELTSDAADFDLNNHQAVYRGHVKVVDPQVKLTCDWMVVDLPQTNGHLNHVLADTNVVVDFTDNKGQINHVTADRAVYDYKVEGVVTNETVTFTGHANCPPMAELPDYTIISEPLIWDRAANKFHLMNEKIIPRHGLNNPDGGTNASLLNNFK